MTTLNSNETKGMADYLPTVLQQYTAASKYSRWLDEEKRREIWPEPALRYIDKVVRPVLTGAGVSKKETEEVCSASFDAIANTRVFPSMRALMTAGPALDRDHVAGYNCSFTTIDSPRAFDEILYILACGTGVGFSVERQFISKLPEVPEELHDTDTTIHVADSKIGWAKAFKELIGLLYSGMVPRWDVSKVRPKGERLKTFGGRASGPGPLVDLFNYTVRTFKGATGRKLNSVECHGIVCKIGEAIVVGGVRRCLPEGSLVHTKRGLVPIESVVPGVDYALTKDGYRKITNKFAQGQQKTVAIKTQTGEFICTPNHKMAVLTDAYGGYEWKQAGELEENDRLIFTAVPTEGVSLKMPASSYERSDRAHTAKPISIPDLDEEMAWFIGYFQANGHSTIRHTSPTKRNSAVSISVPDTAAHLVEVIRTQIERFGVNTRVRDGCGACLSIRAASVELALWLQEHVKSSNESMVVPAFIAQNTESVRAAYIAGLMDGDGSNSSRPIQIMSCIHRDFLNQLQSLCASLGFATRVHCNRPAKGNWKALYRILLKGTKQETRFYASVGQHLKYKIEEPRTRSVEKYSYSIPAWMIQESGRPEHKKHYHQNYAVNCPIETWEACTGMSFDFSPIKVLSVEPFEECETWDIEVEDRHEFYCNGYLTHNSACLSLSNLTDQRMRNAKSGQWWEAHPEYTLANNSVAYTEKPDIGIFLEEWTSLYQSKSGERGIFNRQGVQRKAKTLGKREPELIVGTNPLNLAA